MWKPNPAAPAALENDAMPQPANPRVQSSMAAHVSVMPQTNVSMIGKNISFKGEITGSEPLHVEGRVEGPIKLPGAYLNVGPEAAVKSNIEARELVVRGKVVGSVTVSERIDIRSGGSLVGDVVAHSVSIEEGAFLKGSIDMRRSEPARPAIEESKPAKPFEVERAKAVSA
ncbi:MAG: bactofilin family protein [Terriglobales bacterium]